MKKYRTISTVFYAASALYFIFAILNLANNDSSMCVFWIALGSSFLCLGSVFAQKANGSDDGNKNDKID